ncbi:hypothetical protein TUSST3_64040 [Streptomyces sp. TUS-ST3]|nr:hypothetical protein TUSST3_64040 [Streptomyces sp. TUS-ST3]
MPEVSEALGEHGTVLHRHDGDQQKRDQTQDLADTADGEALGRASLGEFYRCHTGRGFPRRANGGLRKRDQGLTCGHRVLRSGGRDSGVDLNNA